MEMTKIQKIVSGGIIVLAMLSVYIYIDRGQKAETPVSENNATTTDSTNNNSKVSIEASGTGQYTIRQISSETIKTKAIPTPDLERPVKFDPKLSFTDEAKNLITSKITSLQSELKKDSSKLLNWLDLGMYQKIAGDYEGALISWKYVSDMAPKDYVSLGNIGDLYAFYLKDNGMAEVYYKKAITNDPKQTYLYVQLAYVYKDAFKDNAKAIAILDQGLKVLPGDKALLELKESISKI